MKKGKLVVMLTLGLCLNLIACKKANTAINNINCEAKATEKNQCNESNGNTKNNTSKEDDSNKNLLDTISTLEEETIPLIEIETLTLTNAKKNNYIIRLNKTITSSQSIDEIYNIDKLDTFIKNHKNRKTDTITLIEYGQENEIIFINKLFVLKTDGKEITEIVYNVFSDEDNFKPSDKINYKDIFKKEKDRYVRYSLSTNSNIDEDIKLISFEKTSIKN